MADNDQDKEPVDFLQLYRTATGAADLANALFGPTNTPLILNATKAADTVGKLPGLTEAKPSFIDPVSTVLFGIGKLGGIFDIAGPSKFDENTMYGRPYPMPGTPGSVNPFAAQSPSTDMQAYWSDLLQQDPALLAAYTGGSAFDYGGLGGQTVQSEQAQSNAMGKLPTEYKEISSTEGNAQSPDFTEGSYTDPSGVIWNYDVFGNKWKVYDPNASTSSSSSSSAHQQRPFSGETNTTTRSELPP